MKKIILLCLSFLSIALAFSQKATVTWGDDFKMHKSGSDLAVVYADNTGVYLKESHATMSGYFVITATYRESATLIKLDKSFTEIYSNDFNKELKGKEFEQFFVLQDQLYILASNYEKKTKTLTLYGATVDKATGDLSGDWQEITNWQKEDKNDLIDFKVNCSADSSKMVLVSSVEGKDNNTYEVRQFDKNFKQTDKPVVITNEFDPKTFQLEDVLYTSGGNIVLVGRVYEYEDGKKKKDKFLDFKNYNVRIYDNQGKQIKEINTDINAKWLVSTKVVQEKDKDLVLAAFYSDEKKGKFINGLLVQRINPVTGDVVSTSQKAINTSLISTIEADSSADDDNKNSDKEKKKLQDIQDANEGFSKDMRFRKIFYTPDNGIVILAEKYYVYTYTVTDYEPGSFGGMGTMYTRTYTVFESGDLMMSKVDAAGNIAWLNILPKDQTETIESGGYYNGGFNIGSYYFSNSGMPFYSGFGAIQTDNSINLIFNDNQKNANVLQLGQKLKTVSNFRNSACYMVTLDELTGKYKRQSLFNNEDVPTAMPRLGSVVDKSMYIIGRQDRILAKTRVAVGIISLKD
jgi:hypothetical protein